MNINIDENLDGRFLIIMVRTIFFYFFFSSAPTMDADTLLLRLESIYPASQAGASLFVAARSNSALPAEQIRHYPPQSLLGNEDGRCSKNISI